MNGDMPSGSGSMPSASCIIVTLPQTTISYTSAGDRPASSQTSPARPFIVSCARCCSISSASGSIIVADTREITSAPNGCWRFSIERTASGWPVARSSSVATTVVVPRSKAIAWRRSLVSPGSTSISTSSQMTAVTLKLDDRRVRPMPRAAPSSTRSSKSSTALTTRSMSDAWSSSDGSSSSR